MNVVVHKFARIFTLSFSPSAPWTGRQMGSEEQLLCVKPTMCSTARSSETLSSNSEQLLEQVSGVLSVGAAFARKPARLRPPPLLPLVPRSVMNNLRPRFNK